jgi:hypothetical protein
MVQNNQKIGFYAVLGHLGTSKWTHKGTQMPARGRDVRPNIYASKKAANQINRPILVREMVQNNQKIEVLIYIFKQSTFEVFLKEFLRQIF